MVVDYYKKFNFSREVEKQEAILRIKLKQDKRMYVAFKSEIEKNKEKLKLLREQGKHSEEEKLVDIIEKSEKEFRRLEKKIQKVDTVLPPEGEDNTLFKDKISDAYFEIRYMERMHLLEKEYNTIVDLPESPERELKIRDLKKRASEIVEVYQVLGKASTRKQYLKELEHQEYLESLENDRRAREKEEENHVKKALGEDFNPDMSSWKRDDNSYRWRVRLYDEPEKLFVGTSNYDKTPQINQQICAYRYGTFEYGALLKDNGDPTITDELCEIIGVTKKAIDGRVITNFVIAPLRYISGIRAETIDSKGKIVNDTSQNHPTISKKSKTFLERIFESTTLQSEKLRGRLTAKGKLSDTKDSKKYTRVLVAESEKYHVPEEDREFFANIYLSDYLINNAVKNNAGYLGTYEFDKEEKGVTLDLPMENTRVGACFFAQRKPGVISKKSLSKEREATVENIDVLFDKLRIKQIIMASSDLKKLDSTIQMSDIRKATEGEEHE